MPSPSPRPGPRPPQLRAGLPAELPVYDFKRKVRCDTTTVIEAIPGGVVIVEGVYALHAPIRALADLRVSISGGVHFDLMKRIQRDVARAEHGHASAREVITSISETVVSPW